MQQITIGITFNSYCFENISKWFCDDNTNVVCLSYKEDNVNDIYKCKALVLSGGEDVSSCLERDEFEMKLIKIAGDLKMPILGICRGMQLFNVYNRGSLVNDIEEKYNITDHKIINSKPQFHEIYIKKGTLLYEICNSGENLPDYYSSGIINSAHHQCIDLVGNNIIASGFSIDLLIEAIELKDKTYFFLGIQWHPELMPDNFQFSTAIKKRLIEEARKFSF